ncbi:MAG: hypothetical protein HYT67_00660 [Candidatus Yanofskybacteria bacterium]|nr:hypothetical protein [Candidatus Yanofskybacteria bacterium]
MPTIKRLGITLFVAGVFAAVFAAVFSELNNLLERQENRKIIYEAKNFGVETTTHSIFVKRSVRNTILAKTARIVIFLGPYKSIFGSDGRLKSDPPNYFVFLDMHFYHQLEPDEQEALIAHELGHAIYKPDPQEQAQLKLEYRFRRQGLFKEWHDQISTKYQMKADGFSVEKTSIRSVRKLLRKLYEKDKEPLDYWLRVKNLNTIEQGQ